MRAPISPLTLVVSLAAWTIVCVLMALDEGAPAVARADLLGGWLVGTITGFIRNLLSNDPGNNNVAVARAIVNLQGGLSDVAKGLRDFVGEMRGWLGGLVGLLKAFRTDVVLPIVKWLRDHITQLKAWLKKIFGPVINALLKIRKELLRIYEKFVRPVLEVISAVRFVLQSLSRLGVKWAGELDARIARIESAINKNFAKLLLEVNKWIDVVDSVVTLDLLFQRAPFLRTLVRDAGYLGRVFWNTQLKSVPPPASREGEGEDVAPRSPGVDESELREFLRSGGGPKAGIIRELGAMTMAAAQRRAK